MIVQILVTCSLEFIKPPQIFIVRLIGITISAYRGLAHSTLKEITSQTDLYLVILSSKAYIYRERERERERGGGGRENVYFFEVNTKYISSITLKNISNSTNAKHEWNY